MDKSSGLLIISAFLVASLMLQTGSARPSAQPVELDQSGAGQVDQRQYIDKSELLSRILNNNVNETRAVAVVVEQGEKPIISGAAKKAATVANLTLYIVETTDDFKKSDGRKQPEYKVIKLIGQ